MQESAVPCHARDAYENEILQWQQNGWLLPYSEELGPPKGRIPLMVVMQKQKVRPVLDYRELNGFVDAFTANAEVCVQKLREWRRQGVNVLFLDLRNAYLQIHIEKVLWPFQTVIFRGQHLSFTVGIWAECGATYYEVCYRRHRISRPYDQKCHISV